MKKSIILKNARSLAEKRKDPSMEAQAAELFAANTTIKENVSYGSDRDRTVLNLINRYL